MTKKTTINKIISSKAFWIIISLLGSFLLWMYIMSTEETTIEKTFSNVKVVYQGADDLRAARGLIVTDADADSVTVRLKGTRRVLGNLSSADLSAVIDVSGISQAREMQVSYSLQYPTNVDKSSITVLSKTPETISFSVVQEANKTLEVKGVFTGSVKEGYTAEPIKVEPSSITLYGPQEELDVVDSICVYVTRTDLDKSIAPTNCPYVLLDKDGNKLTDYISIKVRGPLAERCAEFAWKGCKLAASGDFETITFEDEPERQPGFLIKASDVEFLSPRKAEDAAQAVEDMSASEDAA